VIILIKVSIFMKITQEKRVLEILETQQYASVDELSAALSVSASTIRRTLEILQQKGLVTRTHGGVKINGDNNFSPSFTFRIHQNSFEKKKIALSAIKLIKNGDIIFLDGSTSAYYIAEYLSEFNDLRVVTNSIDTLSLLSKNNIAGYSTGGRISNANRSVLVGEKAIADVCAYHADIAFFSTSSISKNGEVFDCFEEENVIRSYMLINYGQICLFPLP
jgi:DeoR/GlpR family transcriptional regulator of sugar metabolism